MKRFSFIYIIVLGIVLYSCQTVNLISIDYLVPAEVNFPPEIKRVGIVNNVGEAPGRIEENTALDSIILIKSNGYMERYILNGDPELTAEALAEAIAAENYFNEVIICDSALQVSGMQKQEEILNWEKVNELAESLDVDMLIALEQIQIQVQRQVYPMSDAGFLGTVDAKVFPTVTIYIPNRKAPLVMINGNDSIFWEDFQNTLIAARTKIAPDEKLIVEASEFAGSVPVKYMTPHWKTASRFIYTSGSPEMRDAAFFAQANEWDKALPLWEKAYDKSKGKKKAKIASNISLYYEMNDDLEKAYEWGQKALEQVKAEYKIPDNIEEENNVILPYDYARIYYNQTDLIKRRSNFVRLKVQMDRFNDDF